jgi:Tfp pilus assembly protein PilF
MALKCRETHSRKEKGITYFNLGLIAHKKGEYQRAMTLYSKALGVNPCCPGVHTNLAALLLGPDNKNLEEVRQVLAKAIECGHDAEIPIALSNLGIVLMKMGKSDKAIDTLNKAMEIDPDNPLTLLRLGYAYKEKGLLGRASIYMKKLLGQHPTDITGLLSLAEVYVRAGDMGKCSTILARLVDTVPPDEFILYLRGIRHRKNIIDLVPDMDLLLPFLSEAYHSKALLLERNHQYCLEARGNMK